MRPSNSFSILDQSKEILFFAHHPLCPEFKGHMIPFLGKKICIGCLFGYSSGIIGIVLGVLLNFLYPNLSMVIFFSILAFSVIIIIVIFLVQNLPFSERGKKITQKTSYGLILGIVVTTGVRLIPVHWIIQILLFCPIVGLSLYAMEHKHLKKTRHICLTCDLGQNHPNCPLKSLLTKENPYASRIETEFSVL